MRIGDLDYLNDPKASQDSNRGETAQSPDEPELTERQKKQNRRKNWWYYYKWYVICGVILGGILVNLTGSYLGWWTKAPDFQIAYIGKTQLPSETASALEDAFASIAWDFNGDGKVIVQVNQYVDGLESDDPDTAYYEYASEISLIADISDCESYFFLMDDPEQFQRDYQLLASPDGGCPDDTDYSVDDKVLLWSACPDLSRKDLGTYTMSLLGNETSGSNQELLWNLSIGRRCFFNEKTTEHADACGELWNLLSDSCQ